MQTVLRSATTEVEISTGGPFIMIGEKINPTGRKKLAEALQQHNITDPIKLGATLRAIDLLLGRDLYAKSYIKYLRAHPLTANQ